MNVVMVREGREETNISGGPDRFFYSYAIFLDAP